MHNRITTYEPDNSLKRGYLLLISDIFKEIYVNKWLIYQLFYRDFLAMYKQSILGVLWVFIIPLAGVATFVILNKSGILSVGNISTPYPIFVIIGLALWQIFAIGIINSSNAVVSAGSMITKINFSKKSLILASFGQTIILFAVQLILASILLIIYSSMPHPLILLLPIMAIPLFLLTIGLGFIVSLLNAVMRDISRILAMILPLILFLTPILYRQPDSGLIQTITKYNIFYYLISVPRELALTGATNELTGYLISTVITIIIFLICIIAFHVTETRIAERV